MTGLTFCNGGLRLDRTSPRRFRIGHSQEYTAVLRWLTKLAPSPGKPPTGKPLWRPYLAVNPTIKNILCER